MNIPILIANVLTFLAFIIHTFVGDKEHKILQPETNNTDWVNKQEKWTVARCGWHWVSLDLLFASIGLAVINFTDFFENEKILLQILTIYFLVLSLVWIFIIFISKHFEKNYIKLGQWLLLLIFTGLIYWGTL